jgi:hypothetical protein
MRKYGLFGFWQENTDPLWACSRILPEGQAHGGAGFLPVVSSQIGRMSVSAG